MGGYMKSLIVYYSYSGNTKKAAAVLADHLKQLGDAQLIEIHCLDETSSFLGQCRRAFKRTRGKIEPVNFDLSGYDLVCIGTPVWAFAPAPAINTYVDNCSGVEKKHVLLFTTYGSGTGNQRCLNYMKQLLLKKGAAECKQFSIQQGKVSDKDFVLSQIKDALK
jgi:flavodoxin